MENKVFSLRVDHQSSQMEMGTHMNRFNSGIAVWFTFKGAVGSSIRAGTQVTDPHLGG